MKKKTLAALIIGISLVSVAAIGGTMAAFTAQTTTANEVSTGFLGVSIYQSGSAQDEGKSHFSFSQAAAPGQTIDEAVYAKGDAGSKDMYLRVTATKYWTDAEGKKIVDGSADASEIKLITADTSNWFVDDKSDANGEEVYFYYKKPISAGESTTEIMNQFSILTDSLDKNSNSYSGKKVNIDFDIDAVQKIAGKDAMMAEWGVDATLDGNGNITAFTVQ